MNLIDFLTCRSKLLRKIRCHFWEKWDLFHITFHESGETVRCLLVQKPQDCVYQLSEFKLCRYEELSFLGHQTDIFCVNISKPNISIRKI